MGREANMEKYQKIIELIKAVNDEYPEHNGFIYIILFDDKSGHFEYFDFSENENRKLEGFGETSLQSLDDLFVKYGIE